ncbi:hypothetical protein HAZT_HAZT010927 [Hyalella azteca]|uniref:Peptidase M16 N-terminal domain-containing protein n=1 Tax=Hyalella azteca TaxID=294128 RepID=A0A6A0GYV1_HYAAZ|nr:hypothetical protein HAZT_HAZT010927 [Hyalella azteca]
MKFIRFAALLSLLSYGGAMSPAGANLSSRHAQFFDQLCSITLDNGLVVNKFRSRRTGLHVILARVEGPIVSGYFTLATEALDDDGLPHTLEHLVFLGSEKYPYKGVLDLLANRCLASGTNAWTDTDHTAFTIETAGSEGFLNHLPIYLDHLLYPTLTDASFKTEVYHVTGDGEDAGVVYSEMQSRENSGADRSFLALQRAFYPEPECGYKYETGGLMFNLRNSTTNEKIRAYHREFYRPENLHLIITGQVEASKLFEVLIKFEESILAKGPRPPFTRPWQRPVAPLMASVRKEVVYPSNTEDNGRVLVAWRGPSASKDYRQLVLLIFSTFVIELISMLSFNLVSHYVSENQASNCYLKFTGVPLEHMEMVEPLMRTTLENLYSGTDGDGIDLAQMREFLSHLILTQLSELETSPRDTLAYAIIGDALYGNTCQDVCAATHSSGS